MKVLVTGGTGFIGRGLCSMLLREGHYLKIITRNPAGHRDEQSKNQQFISWEAGLSEAMEWADAVINLAGENIFSQRWTDEVKQKIYSSRIESTERLAEAIRSAENPPEVMISGSAVGYYGGRGIKVIDENEPAGNDFLAKVCIDWEEAAKPVEECGVRLIISRTGIVLEKGGGVLKKMLPAFRFFAGGPVGRGTQFVPWIHRYDLCQTFIFFLENKSTEGPYNICSPDPVTMEELAKSLGDVLNRPSFLRVPEWALKTALGEAAKPALESLRAQPARLEQSEFEFRYIYLTEALSDIV